MSSASRIHSFVGGLQGPWQATGFRLLAGESIPSADRLTITSGDEQHPLDATWVLRGITSHDRYVTRGEKELLRATQPPLGRKEAICAVLIPIRKSPAWWALTQDERRLIFEEQSHHTRIGLDYLPAIARRLHHCRDLGEHEPFDFLTWFEFAESDTLQFDDLLQRLRASEEWKYVDREVELRFRRTG